MPVPYESAQKRDDRLMQKALGFTEPFGISDVGEGVDYSAAARLLKRLHKEGHLRIATTNNLRDQYGATRYEWIN